MNLVPAILAEAYQVIMGVVVVGIWIVGWIVQKSSAAKQQAEMEARRRMQEQIAAAQAEQARRSGSGGGGLTDDNVIRVPGRSAPPPIPTGPVGSMQYPTERPPVLPTQPTRPAQRSAPPARPPAPPRRAQPAPQRRPAASRQPAPVRRLEPEPEPVARAELPPVDIGSARRTAETTSAPGRTARVAPEARTASIAKTAAQTGQTNPTAGITSAQLAAWLKPATMQRQYILTEILRPPLALRDPE